MIDALLSRPKLLAALGGLAVLILIGLALLQSFHSTAKTTVTTDPQQVTAFHSNLTKNSDGLTINYGGSSSPNYDAVMGSLRVFGIDLLPLPQSVKDSLLTNLRQAMVKQVALTNAPAYLQINADTIQCQTQFDCRFSVYLDSPESYFDFHLFNQANGSQTYTIQRLPLPEVQP